MSSRAPAGQIPAITPGRAALIGLMDRYLAGLLDPFVSLLEVHKPMYLMQEAGEPLSLRMAKGHYGPYAENLRHVLGAIEGHYVSGYGAGGDAPDKVLELVPGAVENARATLAKRPETRDRFERVAKLVEGFESPFGLELLATVHWVATRKEQLRGGRDQADLRMGTTQAPVLRAAAPPCQTSTERGRMAREPERMKAELPSGFRKSPNLVVEVDAMPGGYVCSASMKGVLPTTAVRGSVAGERPLRKLFSKEQRAFFDRYAPAGASIDDLSVLGPIFVLKLKLAPRTFSRRLVAEMSFYPDGTRVVEMSTKCLPGEGLDVAGELLAFFNEKGIDVSGEQHTKTKTALEFFSAELQAQSS